MLKKWLKNLFDLLERPLPYFFTFHLRPKRTFQIGIWSDKLKSTPKCAIVIQGPILYEQDFTLETIRLYKKIFPEAVIILSTWDYEKPEYIEKIKSENIEIILNKLPEESGYANINYQIFSACNGIKKAKELGVEYVLKIRTDQRIYNPNAFEFLCNIIEKFSVAAGYKQTRRIIGVSLNTFKYRRYGLSDMTLFGEINDMLLYWSADLRNDKEIERINGCCKMCETYLSSEFLVKVGRNLSWTLEDSLQVFSDHFCVIDYQSLDLYWYKYSRFKEYRYLIYNRLYNSQELTFLEWFNLYANFKNKIVTDEKIIKVIL